MTQEEQERQRRRRERDIRKNKNRPEDNPIYPQLVNGLREMSTDPEGLTDAEVMRGFVLYEQSEAPKRDGECVCGKQDLRWLYWIWNKNVEDRVRRTLYHKECVGEWKCVSRKYCGMKSPIFLLQ